MKKLVLLLFISLYIGTTHSQDCQTSGKATIELDANNVNVGLLNSGDFWWDGNQSKYTILSSESSSQEIDINLVGALWFGGEDPNGMLKLAAQQHRIDNFSDFYPGPLEFGINSATLEDCENWDRFWKVNKSDVDSHIDDFNDNNAIDNPLTSIYSWPGMNNQYFTANNGFDMPTDHSLAPFFDKNQDGNYDPDQGDYPLIKGSQSIWWVFNDLSGPHRFTLSTPLSIEVQAMAYAESSENDNINNATYYDFKVTNKGTEPLLNSYMGLFTDFDLNCLHDGHLGFNEEYQMMYAYEEEEIETQCPGGTTPFTPTNSIVGIKSKSSVSSYSVFQRGSSQRSGPEVDSEYYNILRGLWKDGTAMTFGGNGYDPNSTDTVSFLYTGDPSNENQWSMCTVVDPNFEDHRSVMSNKIGTLQPGQSFTNSYAFIFVENQDYPCPSLEGLKEAADDVSNNISTTTLKLDKGINVQIYPNPVKDIIYINSEKPIQRIQLLSMNGQLLQNTKLSNPRSNYSWNLENLSDGLYFVSIQDNIVRTSIEKIIVKR